MPSSLNISLSAQVGEENLKNSTWLINSSSQCVIWKSTAGRGFHQKALPTAYSIASKQLNGAELSFNNIRDADAAIRVIRDFKAPSNCCGAR